MNDTSVLFITFHYWPSNEIGALRTTALSEALAAQGISTTVVSALGGAQSGLREEAHEKYLRFKAIPEPRKWFIKSMVRAKAAIRRLRPRRHPTPTASDPGEPETRESSPRALTSAPSTGGRLSSFVLKMLDLIDGYKLWSWRAANVAIRIAKSTGADVIYSSGPPMTGHIAAYLASKRCRLPLIVDLRDPWVIGSIETLPPRGFRLRVTRWFEHRVLLHAAAITVTTDDLAHALARVEPALQAKIHVVRNGYDGTRKPSMQSTGHRLSVLFAGELYLHRNPFEFLEGMERLLSRSDVDPSKIELVFAGQCDTFRGVRLRDWMKGKRCDEITKILPPVRAKELEPYIERATLLINFAQQQPTSIPAKSYDHMASGREMLICCEPDGATAKLLDGIVGVSIVDPRDTAQMDRALHDLYRRHAIEGVPNVPSDEDAANFSRRRQSEVFVSLVERVREATHS